MLSAAVSVAAGTAVAGPAGTALLLRLIHPVSDQIWSRAGRTAGVVWPGRMGRCVRPVEGGLCIAFHSQVGVAYLCAVDLFDLAVVGEQAVDLVLHVGDLRIDATADAAGVLYLQQPVRQLDVAPGQRRGVGFHLVGLWVARPQVTWHLQAESAILAVDGDPADLLRGAGPDIGVVVVDITVTAVGEGAAAVDSAVRIDQPRRVPRLDQGGN